MDSNKNNQAATDEQAARELLDSNPGMLWRVIFDRNLDDYAGYAKSTAEGWDVYLPATWSGLVLTYTDVEFHKRFEVTRYAIPAISATIDSELFKRTMSGALQVVTA